MELREFHPDIRQWDRFACEAACAVQLLYMARKIQWPIDTKRLDRRAGRRPNTVDLNVGYFRLLLAAGFSITTYEDTTTLPNAARYAHEMRNQGHDMTDVRDYHRRQHPQVVQRRKALEMAYQSPRARRVNRKPAPGDMRSALERGKVVCVVIKGTGRSVHEILLHQPHMLLGTERVRCFEPTSGVRTNTLSAMSSKINGGLIVYSI